MSWLIDGIDSFTGTIVAVDCSAVIIASVAGSSETIDTVDSSLGAIDAVVGSSGNVDAVRIEIETSFEISKFLNYDNRGNSLLHKYNSYLPT